MGHAGLSPGYLGSYSPARGASAWQALGRVQQWPASGSLRCRLAGVDAAVARIHLHLRRQTVGGGLQVDAGRCEGVAN